MTRTPALSGNMSVFGIITCMLIRIDLTKVTATSFLGLSFDEEVALSNIENFLELFKKEVRLETL